MFDVCWNILACSKIFHDKSIVAIMVYRAEKHNKLLFMRERSVRFVSSQQDGVGHGHLRDRITIPHCFRMLHGSVRTASRIPREVTGPIDEKGLRYANTLDHEAQRDHGGLYPVVLKEPGKQNLAAVVILVGDTLHPDS